jgi:hypothetical protein
MSRPWFEHEYVSSTNVWDWIETESNKLDMLMAHDNIESSELCKLLIMGRREMLEAFSTLIHTEEVSLKALLVDRYNAFASDEIDEKA